MKNAKIVQLFPVESGDTYKKMNVLVAVEKTGDKSKVEHVLLEAKNSIIGFVQKLKIGQPVILCYGEDVPFEGTPVISVVMSGYYSEKTGRWFNNIIINRIDQ